MQSDLSAMNTWVKIDTRSISRNDKSELLQTVVDLNILELTKLEVKYSKLQKAHEAMKQQLDTQKVKLKAVENNISILKTSLAAAPTIDMLSQKDAIISQRDADIATRVAKIVMKDTIISSLNTNIAQLQLSLNVNKVDKSFLLNMKKKFWELRDQEIKDLIHLRHHTKSCLSEFKRLEVEVTRCENILNPISEQAKQANKRLNDLSNEKLQSYNIGDQVELMSVINYPMRGKWVYHHIKGNVLSRT